MKIIKQKPILPSLKEKRRYLAFQVISEAKIGASEIKAAILKELESLVGRLGMAKANVSFIDEGIIKVNNKYLDYLKASFVSLKNINDKKAIVRSIGVSGVLNKARGYLA